MSIKSIKEKELLVNFARQMGQEADPRLVEEVKQINNIKARVRESVSENLFKDLSDALKLSKTIPAYEPDDGPLTKEQIVQIKETIDYPKPPSLDDLMLLLGETKIEEVINELVQTQPEEKSPKTKTNVSVQSSPEPVVEKTLADKTSEFISKSKDSFQQPDPLIVASDMDAVTKKLRFLEQWISKVSMAGPGGGAGDSVSLTNYTTTVTTPTYTIKRKDYYVGINYAGAVTITMPTFDVVQGRMIIIKDESGQASTNPITVQGTIDNDAGGFVLQMDNGGVQMIYRNGWRII
jgi:hypothetical protein